MGMTLLHSALLHPLIDCYNYSEMQFNKEALEVHMDELVGLKTLNGEAERMYSEEFIETLAMILEPSPNKRISLMEVHAVLNKVWSPDPEDNANENEAEREECGEEANAQESATKKPEP
jgi:hypothetical protein